jgi:predicted peptidase
MTRCSLLRPLRAGLCLLVLLALSACAAVRPDPAPAGGRFVARTLQLDGHAWRYQVFVPARRDPAGTPVVLFLHGSGERGDDGIAQTRAGLGPYLRAHAADFPAIVVLPQVPEGAEWAGANVRMALAALDAASREFGGDPRRTYLTGMSMGGYGTWETALAAPGRFAALVPVCGGVRVPHPDRPTLRVAEVADLPDPYAALAARIGNTPVWMFHGALDDLVHPDDDRRLYRAFLQAGAADVHYTEYPRGNHNAWDATYADPAMWAWLFSQRNPAAAAVPAR